MNSQVITVVGSTNLDLVVRADRFPTPGETLVAREFSEGPGGKGANQALAAARAGATVRFISAIGSDSYGDSAIKLLRLEPTMDLSSVAVRADTPTGTAHITVDATGENTILVNPGANTFVTPLAVDAAGDLSGIVMVQGEVPRETIEAAARNCSRDGGRLMVNLAPVISVDVEVIRQADPLLANEHEICLIAEMCGLPHSSSHDAIAALQKLGVRSIVLTLGSKGAQVFDGPTCTAIPPTKVVAVDTTGAGDAFAGALAAALSLGKSLVDAATFASRFAAMSVEGAGAQTSYPTYAADQEISC